MNNKGTVKSLDEFLSQRTKTIGSHQINPIHWLIAISQAKLEAVERQVLLSRLVDRLSWTEIAELLCDYGLSPEVVEYWFDTLIEKLTIQIIYRDRFDILAIGTTTINVPTVYSIQSN